MMNPTPHAFGVDDIDFPTATHRVQIVFCRWVNLSERYWAKSGERRRR
jgi:hypothetical protein